MGKTVTKKNRKKLSLSEGFLDGEEAPIQSPENTEPELPEEGVPANDDPENDPAEEPVEGGEPAPEEGTSEESHAEETGVEGASDDDVQRDQLDALQTLTTAVQELTQQIKDMQANQEQAAEPAAEPAPAEPALEEPAAEPEGEPEGGEPEGEPEGEPASEDGEEKPAKSHDDFDGEEENSEEDENELPPESATVESVMKELCEPGKILNENSKYMTGKIYQHRFDKLEPIIMALVKAKIKNRVDGARKEFRAQVFQQQYGDGE